MLTQDNRTGRFKHYCVNKDFEGTEVKKNKLQFCTDTNFRKLVFLQVALTRSPICSSTIL